MAKAGFQGSTTTSCEVAVYSHNDDPVLTQKEGGVWKFAGRARNPEEPALVSMAYDKALGQGAGNFRMTVKAPVGSPFFDTLVDDDWIDIVGNINGRKYHITRGLIDSFQKTTTSREGAATTEAIEIVGRDFGAIFDKTLIWFNRFRAENVGYEKTVDIYKALNIGGDPSECVQRVLFGFLETMAALSPPRANWTLPKQMPRASSRFSDTLIYVDTEFTGDPARVAVSQALMDPDGQGAFALAQEWSDPQFCELLFDLIGSDGLPMDPERQYDVDDTVMAVTFRDRPFPSMRDGRNSPWFRLPTAIVNPQDIDSKNVGRGGLERYNAFFASPQAIQQLSATSVDLHGPLWDPQSIERHGMRPFYVDSRYVCDEPNLFTMSQAQRALVMNFHCLNPYMLNGTISTQFRPDIRVGTRVKIPYGSAEKAETYYVEQVTHSWSLGAPKTTLGVTRGWVGTDGSLLSALSTVSERYKLLPGDDRGPRDFQNLTLSLPGKSTER